MTAPRSLVALAAAGLALGGLTDAALALAGAASFSGPPVGLLCAPLLGLAIASAPVSRPVALLVLGGAWTLAPLLDQHLLGVVRVEGLAFDALHHTLGWLPLLAGSQLLSRSPTSPSLS